MKKKHDKQNSRITLSDLGMGPQTPDEVIISRIQCQFNVDDVSQDGNTLKVFLENPFLGIQAKDIIHIQNQGDVKRLCQLLWAVTCGPDADVPDVFINSQLIKLDVWATITRFASGKIRIQYGYPFED